MGASAESTSTFGRSARLKRAASQATSAPFRAVLGITWLASASTPPACRPAPCNRARTYNAPDGPYPGTSLVSITV
jgi:hypothetical protein